MIPPIVITRPAQQGAAFASALEEAWGGKLPILLAPLMEIVPVRPKSPVENVANVIFTSANGVNFGAPFVDPSSTIAWCVGDQTTETAQAAGFQTQNVQGNSQTLIDALCAARPKGGIVHLHGAHVTGQISQQLTARGVQCHAHVVYQQEDLPPDQALIDALEANHHVIVPLFSQRSTKLFSRILPDHARPTLVAISDSVCASAAEMSSRDVIVAKFPDKSSMITAMLHAIGKY